MSDEIKDRNIRDIRELARAVSDELSRENPKYMDSLRDHFAGLAMQGIIATIAGSGVVIRRDNEPDEQLAVPRHGDLIAQYSYQMADAMLAAREQRT